MTGKTDYMRDGILHCGACGTRKQFKAEFGGQVYYLSCLCKCQAEKREREEAEHRAYQAQMRIESLKANGMQDKSFETWTFENDDGSNAVMMDKAMRYTDEWPKVLKDNIGLLIWGNVGTGKTYFAASIANRLLDSGIPVLMTNFIRIANVLGGYYDDERNNYLKSLDSYKLLIIDDLGAERQSDFMLEQVYSIIDSRYKGNLPIIITTNLTLSEIKNPQDMKYSRIYDRILEMCVPIKYEGESRRKEAHAEKMEKARQLFA